VFRLPTSYPRLAQVCAALCGLALLTTLSLTSHAAAKPGIIPVLSETIHLAGAVVWGGGLLYFALLPWKTIRQETETYGRLLWKLVERFSIIALVAVYLLVVSGAVLAFLHVYGLPAVQSGMCRMGIASELLPRKRRTRERTARLCVSRWVRQYRSAYRHSMSQITCGRMACHRSDVMGSQVKP